MMYEAEIFNDYLSKWLTRSEAMAMMIRWYPTGMNGIKVHWEYVYEEMKEYLHVRIWNQFIKYEYSPYVYPHKIDFVQDIRRKIELEHWSETAKLFNVEIARYIANQWNNDSEKKRKELEEKKQKEDIQIIYLYWAICLIPKIPEELLSSLELAEEAMRLQKEIIQNTKLHEEKVRTHYLKYGTMWEKFINYFK